MGNEAPDILAEVPVTAADLRLQPGNNSPLLAIDPTDERVVVLASRLDNPDFGCGLHVSGDGGRTWAPVDPVPVLPEEADKCYAPEIAFDRTGTLYFLFVGLAGRGNQPVGAYLVTSGDAGVTFGPPRRLLGPLNYMVRMAIDPHAGASGRIHLVWLEASREPPLGGLPTPPNPILASYSDDGGRTWSEAIEVAGGDGSLVVAPALAVGSDRAVHLAYYDLGDDLRDYQGLEGPTWEGRWALMTATSRDGGMSFEPALSVDDAIVPPERVMVIFTMPPPALAAHQETAGVSAAWWDARHGDWDVFLAHSGDAGRSWSGPIRLNDDAVGNDRHQYMPRLAVSPVGRVDAVFYDRRNDERNVFNDVYYTYSIDGHRFAPNIRLTSESSDSRIGTTYDIPSAEGLIEFGSRIALLSTGSEVVAAWTDTRNNVDSIQQDIFSTTVRWGETSPISWWLTSATIVALLAGAIVMRSRISRRRAAEGEA